MVALGSRGHFPHPLFLKSIDNTGTSNTPMQIVWEFLLDFIFKACIKKQSFKANL